MCVSVEAAKRRVRESEPDLRSVSNPMGVGAGNAGKRGKRGFGADLARIRNPRQIRASGGGRRGKGAGRARQAREGRGKREGRVKMGVLGVLGGGWLCYINLISSS